VTPAIEASHLGVEILNAARRWVKARGDLRRALDSKKASPEAVEAAKAAYNRTAEELELHVLKLERLMSLNGIAVSMKKRKKASEPFPLGSFLGAVAAGAKALEAAVNARSGSGSSPDATAKVIDVEPQ
jgi:hypothetical protein